MRDVEAGQSSHTQGLLTRSDSATARSRDQQLLHDEPPTALDRHEKPRQRDCFDYFCRSVRIHCLANARTELPTSPACSSRKAR